MKLSSPPILFERGMVVLLKRESGGQRIEALIKESLTAD
jgi:hypothetical protein